MVGKKFEVFDFEGRTEYKVLSFDGVEYTVASLFNGDILHEFKFLPDDLVWFMEGGYEI